MHILLAEDEAKLARLTARVLSEAGHVVQVVGDGPTALEFARGGEFDILLLDVMLPGMDGFEVARRLRAQGVHSAVLMLTARDTVEDRVRGLDSGADDYLVKPFAFAELLARIRALGRRGAPQSEGTCLEAGGVTLDLVRHEARRGEAVQELTPKEFALLEFLMRNRGQVLTRTQLLDHVWGFDSEAGSNVVDTYVHYLRDKAGRLGRPGLIRTVRGVGYTIASNV